MEQCEFCRATLAADARFCGKCGRVPQKAVQQHTQVSDLATLRKDGGDSDSSPTIHLESTDNDATLIISPHKSSPLTTTGLLRAINLVPIADNGEQKEKKEEDEEENRLALPGIGLSLLGAGALAGEQLPGHIPTISGTPQVSPIASLQGTPQLQSPGTAPIQAFNPSTPTLPPSLPGTPTSAPFPSGPSTPPWASKPQTPVGSGKPAGPGNPSGCLVTIIVVAITLVILLTSTIGLGLTLWAPNISLSGDTTALPGKTLTLHGDHFLPNSNVTLTLDNNIPIYHVQITTPSRLASTSIQTTSALQLLSLSSPSSSNVVSVDGDGTFTVNLLVNLSWTPGQHIIHAAESVTHRSAALDFTISQTGIITTPTPTPTQEPMPTLTPTPAPTLSCANPGTVSLGPVSEFSSQVATGTITLCSSGSGTINWHASWGATWLHLSQNNGSIQAPAQTQITVTAVVTGLAVGNYSTTVTFTNLKTNASKSVNISLTVQAGCVSVTPTTLNFTGVANVSNPSSSQTISVTNCGLTSGWLAGITNANNWLSISATQGVLGGGATTQITVKASNLKAGLNPGTYSDFIVVHIGSRTSTITVRLTVVPTPTISANPTTLVAANNPPCSAITNGSGAITEYSCTVTLTNNSSLAPVTWSASAASGITIQAASNTMAAGGSEPVTIGIPANDCGQNITITFTGPTNSVPVAWECFVIQ